MATSLLLVLLAASAGAEDRIVRLSAAAALPGQTADVQLVLSELEAFAGGDFAVAFDPAVVSVVGAGRTEATGDFLLVSGEPSPGRATLSMAGVQGLAATGEGAIAILTLRAADGAAPGTQVPLTVRAARWYDEESVRHELLGDHAVFEVGTAVPADEPLRLSLGDAAGIPSAPVSVPLVLNIGQDAAAIGARIEFDPALLADATVTAGPSLAGWTINTQIDEGAGAIVLSLQDFEELAGLVPVEIARCNFVIAPDASSGTTAIRLAEATVRNREAFRFALALESGQVESLPNAETPTPIPTETPTPSETPGPQHSADFDGDGVIDCSDLLRLLDDWHQQGETP